MINYVKSDEIAGIILAGGLSRRLGRPKQLLRARGQLLLAQVLEAVLEAGLEPTILVLGNQADQVREALKFEYGLAAEQRDRITMVVNKDFADGQASSVKTGIKALPPETGAAMFVMGDQARLDPQLLGRITQAYFQQGCRRIIRPAYGQVPGGPVLWPRRFFPDLMKLRGDTGGRKLFQRLPADDLYNLELEPETCPLDIDTEEDYDLWVRDFDPPEAIS